MKDDSGTILFERFMETLSDGEWHTVEELATKLSLSIDSLAEFLKDLEDAEVIQVEGDSYDRKNLVKGTSFVEDYLELPDE